MVHTLFLTKSQKFNTMKYIPYRVVHILFLTNSQNFKIFNPSNFFTNTFA